MKRVEGKIALVTGGASRPGLGSATAARLAEEGAVVFVTDVDGAGAEAVAADIRAHGGNASALTHDVTSEADWERVMTAIVAENGRLDILVNNAGIALLNMVEAVTPQEWFKQIEVNLTSVYLGTRRAVMEMRRTGGGSIINLSSVVGSVGVPGCSAYGASKGGVRLFSKTVALEGARDNIRVNTVHPGMILTNMNKVAVEDNSAQNDILVAGIPMQRLGEPDDIAYCILYLASDESKYVTGTEFTVDGGMTAQ